MPVYFLNCQPINRKKGSRVTQAAAYRSGERIRDERTSEIYDHSHRDDVAYKEVVLPTDLSGREDMAWTQNRALLWNAAEHAGVQRNSRLARDWFVLLPAELTAQQRTKLVTRFARELADKHRCAVDVCIHLPRPKSDPRSHHAHLLMTTRQITPSGLGRRIDMELGGRERQQLGISGSSKQEYLAIRARWAEVTNEAFREAGLQLRIDHRSYREQGINREPVAYLPKNVFYAERKRGSPTAAGNEIRAKHRERLEARAQGDDARERALEKRDRDFKNGAFPNFNSVHVQPKQLRRGQLNRQERNAMRRARYQALREKERADPVAEAKRRAARHAEYKARLQRNPKLNTEVTRRWRNANPERAREIAQRYRQAHREEINDRQREYRAARNRSTTLSAEQSARNWQKYRETHGPGPTAEQAARNWLALRERNQQSDLAQAENARPNREQHSLNVPDDDDTHRKRRRQHDRSIEM